MLKICSRERAKDKNPRQLKSAVLASDKKIPLYKVHIRTCKDSGNLSIVVVMLQFSFSRRLGIEQKAPQNEDNQLERPPAHFLPQKVVGA